LRVLLEYYRREKKIRFSRIEELYSKMPKVGSVNKTGINFGGFCKIMEQFDSKITKLDVRRFFLLFF
jgi:hypothetical protein